MNPTNKVARTVYSSQAGFPRVDPASVIKNCSSYERNPTKSPKHGRATVSLAAPCEESWLASAIRSWPRNKKYVIPRVLR